MSFQNLPVTIIALLAGWSFTIYLQHRANHRAEALKRKDKLIDKLEDLSGWVGSEIAKDEFDPNNVERSYSGFLSHIELRIGQFNSHVRREVVDPNKLIGLRRANFFADKKDLCSLPYDVRDDASDVIEHIELECNSMFFESSLLRKVESVYQELKGIIAGVWVVVSALVLGKVITLFY